MATEQTTGKGRPKDAVVDGEQGRHFTCSVKPNGDKFDGHRLT